MIIKTDQEALDALAALIKYFIIRGKTALEKQLTVPEICDAISKDFKRRRITHKIAAEMIHTTKQTISNQLTGKRRFSQNMAKKFSDAFGYSLPWLLFGEGKMFND